MHDYAECRYDGCCCAKCRGTFLVDSYLARVNALNNLCRFVPLSFSLSESKSLCPSLSLF